MDPLRAIGDMDFIFRNTPVKVIANRKYSEIKLAGLQIGPFLEGKEYKVRFWLAQELQKAGIVRFREESSLNLVKLNKIHWKERIQSHQRISSLPENFYPLLRRCLADLKKGAVRKPEQMRDYEKAKSLSRDIINLRLKKIISLASAPAQTHQMLMNLTKEEGIIHERLSQLIRGWRIGILSEKVSDKS